ncbi:unnamed protein product [Alopecurus aequalis]
MAESVLILVTEKIGIALAKGAAEQACFQFSKYATKLKELHENMERVQRELHVMKDVLYEMDIRNHNNKAYESWLDGVQKVAHAMEDMVDEYLYRVGRKHNLGYCFYLEKGFRKPTSLISFYRIASNVKKIKKDLTHLSEMKHRWLPVIINGDTSSSNYIVKRSHNLANISRSLNEEDLIGVDENRAKLEQWLGCKDGKCSVTTPVGMGGIGKTTLAANVYKKERGKFQCHAWVSISQTYSREDVLRNLINELFKDKVDVPPNIVAMDTMCLEDTLKRFLEQKKYLIILDDVWSPEVFHDLSPTLLCNDKGSRLLITTREGDVAALASQGHTLTLEALPSADAWDLFCKKSFPWETNHECPEDLKHLSEEIVSKCKGLPLAIVSVGSLLHVREKSVEEWRRINGQLSWEIINNPRLDHIKNVLHLSFIYLPMYLKSCFLYCSLFLEDYLFQRKKLVRLWIAEGFIVEKGESTLEEVAEGYLNELINRNMLQLIERNSFGRIKMFKMHDILRELGVELCQKDRFGVKYEEHKCGGSLQRDERRLLVHKLDTDSQQLFSSVHGLRTFIALDKNMPSFNVLHLLSEKSRYITVLELSGLTIEKIPCAIGDLFNLRHLGFAGYKSEMPFLSKLDVGASYDNGVLMLNAFPRNLQKLTLSGRLAEGTLLGESPLLQAVEQYLHELSLQWSQLREDPLPSLSRLANLTKLFFIRAYNREKLVFLTGWFPKLKVLYLMDLPNLKQLEIKQGAMATLESFALLNLSSMVEVPPGIEFLKTLQYLGFELITRDFLTVLHQCPRLAGMQWEHSLRD